MHMLSKGLNARGAQKTFWPLAAAGNRDTSYQRDTLRLFCIKKTALPQEGKIDQE
jgi:hypothetical protein